MKISEQPKEVTSLRVISFQGSEVSDKLLSGETFSKKTWGSPRSGDDKTPFYQKLLNTKNVPCYSFASLRFYDDDIEVSPSLLAISGSWSTLMSYYGLMNRDIIEMDIPIKEGIIGNTFGCKVINDIWEKTDATELVTSCFSHEWVREVYKRKGDKDVYESQMNTDPYALFSGTCEFSYSYIRCHKYLWCAPRVGFTVFENSRRLEWRTNKEFLTEIAEKYIGMPFSYHSREDLVFLMLLVGDYIVEEV